jgi:predicted nucleic acid-binding protein
MASIDLNRLRHYVNSERAAHAEVRRLSEKRTAALTEVTRCRTNLAEYQKGYGAPRRSKREAELTAALDLARRVLKAIDSDLAAAKENWHRAADVKKLVMEYAAPRISIPHDLLEA